MIDATQSVIPIMADVSKGGTHKELKAKYGVTGFPTIVFTDSKGNAIERLNARDGNGVKAQMVKIAENHTKRVFVEIGLDEARSLAVKESKLLAILYTDEKAKSQPKNDMMMGALLDDSMQDLLERFVWIQRPLREGKKTTAQAKAFGASKSPTLVVVDPAAEALDKKAVLKKLTKAKGMKKNLVKVLNKAAKKKK